MLVACLAASGCTSLHLARTVGRGNVEAVASLGGPVAQVGSVPFPLPRLHAGARVGVTDDIDAMAHVSLDALGSAVVAFDGGIVTQMTRVPRGFAMSLSVQLDGLVDLDDPALRLYPRAGLHLEQPLDASWTLFGGLEGLGQVDPPPRRPFLFVAPYLGIELGFDPVHDDVGRAIEQTGIALQVAWIAPGLDSSSPLRWVPDDAGALSIVLGLRHRFGGLDR